MTKEQQKLHQDARVLVATHDIGPALHKDIGDAAGDKETNTFVTPGQALASLKRLEKDGLVNRQCEKENHWCTTYLPDYIIDVARQGSDDKH